MSKKKKSMQRPDQLFESGAHEASQLLVGEPATGEASMSEANLEANIEAMMAEMVAESTVEATAEAPIATEAPVSAVTAAAPSGIVTIETIAEAISTVSSAAAPTDSLNREISNFLPENMLENAAHEWAPESAEQVQVELEVPTVAEPELIEPDMNEVANEVVEAVIAEPAMALGATQPGLEAMQVFEEAVEEWLTEDSENEIAVDAVEMTAEAPAHDPIQAAAEESPNVIAEFEQAATAIVEEIAAIEAARAPAFRAVACAPESDTLNEETISPPAETAPAEPSSMEATEAAPAAELQASENTEPAPAAELQASAEAQPAPDNGPVTFIADPYGFPSAETNTEIQSDAEVEAEIAAEMAAERTGEPAEEAHAEAQLEAQPSADSPADAEVEADEELADQPLELAADDGALDRVAAALNEEQKREEQELQDALAAIEKEAADRLAAEIAEDQALAAEEAAQEADQAETEFNLDMVELESCIEALLFMSDKPLSVNKLRELLGPNAPLSLFQEAMTNLQDRYNKTHHGIEIVEVGEAFQFRTKVARADLARKLARVQTQKLSSGAMETLAIVAYRQPVLKDDIDKIRGVDSSHFVRGLLDKNLIRISGRSELPGRPMLYATTDHFLELFGLKSLSDMPSLREVEQMIPATEVNAGADDNDPRVKAMRKLVGEMNMDVSVTLAYDPKEDQKILQDIREKVNSIPVSTPYLEEQKRLEKEAADRAAGLLPPLEDPAALPPVEGMPLPVAGEAQPPLAPQA